MEQMKPARTTTRRTINEQQTVTARNAWRCNGPYKRQRGKRPAAATQTFNAPTPAQNKRKRKRMKAVSRNHVANFERRNVRKPQPNARQRNAWQAVLQRRSSKQQPTTQTSNKPSKQRTRSDARNATTTSTNVVRKRHANARQTQTNKQRQPKRVAERSITANGTTAPANRKGATTTTKQTAQQPERKQQQQCAPNKNVKNKREPNQR